MWRKREEWSMPHWEVISITAIQYGLPMNEPVAEDVQPACIGLLEVHTGHLCRISLHYTGKIMPLVHSQSVYLSGKFSYYSFIYWPTHTFPSLTVLFTHYDIQPFQLIRPLSFIPFWIFHSLLFFFWIQIFIILIKLPGYFCIIDKYHFKNADRGWNIRIYRSGWMISTKLWNCLLVRKILTTLSLGKTVIFLSFAPSFYHINYLLASIVFPQSWKG